MVAVNTTQNGSTWASPDNEKTGTHTVPLQKLFEQLESSEQGLTGAEARKHWTRMAPMIRLA